MNAKETEQEPKHDVKNDRFTEPLVIVKLPAKPKEKPPRTRDFNPDEARDDSGKWTSGGGGSSGTSKEKKDYTKKLDVLIERGSSENPDAPVTASDIKVVREATLDVLNAMPPGLAAAAMDSKRGVFSVVPTSNQEGLVKTFHSANAKDAQGMYSFVSRKMGIATNVWRDDPITLIKEETVGFYNANQRAVAHITAHELAHAADKAAYKGPKLKGGIGERISASPEWHSVWKDEIAAGKLTKYGASSQIEGFAEFGRAVTFYPTYARERFPKSYEFFTKHGLADPHGPSKKSAMQGILEVFVGGGMSEDETEFYDEMKRQ